MHIYRLAIELGLVDVIYLDWRARAAWAGPLAELETKRLQRLPRDPSQWGGWAAEVHESGIQQNRQYRAYSIVREEQHSVLQTPCSCCDSTAVWTLDRSNQSMKPTAPFRNNPSVVATTPCRGLSLSR